MSLIVQSVQRQKAAEKELLNEISNFLKEPKERLENFERVKGWIPRINGFYTQFRENHQELMTHQGNETVKEYLKRADYEKVCAQTEAVLSKVNSHIARLKAVYDAKSKETINNMAEIEKNNTRE